jgi:phytoene dehydrogenase-like protein
MLRFLFRMFSSGEAVLPRLGMEAIPRQLAARLPEAALRLGAEVVAVRPGEVVLRSGEVVPATHTVVAVDGTAAARLVPDVPAPRWAGVACLYFAASEPPVGAPLLVLNGEGEGPVNNLCVPTQVAPDYGPAGQALVSVSVLDAKADRADLTSAVRDQLAAWFGPGVHAWRLLRTYRIARALPRQEPGWLEPPQRPVRLTTGLYVAGDHRENASSHGALTSGRRAAEAVLADLGSA